MNISSLNSCRFSGLIDRIGIEKVPRLICPATLKVYTAVTRDTYGCNAGKGDALRKHLRPESFASSSFNPLKTVFRRNSLLWAILKKRQSAKDEYVEAIRSKKLNHSNDMLPDSEPDDRTVELVGLSKSKNVIEALVILLPVFATPMLFTFILLLSA